MPFLILTKNVMITKGYCVQQFNLFVNVCVKYIIKQFKLLNLRRKLKKDIYYSAESLFKSRKTYYIFPTVHPNHNHPFFSHLLQGKYCFKNTSN